jgi:hypothetical protein
MDNLFVMGASLAEASANIEKTLKVLHKLGWQINEEKSSLKPLQCSEFLGLLVDTMVTPWFKVPNNKIQAICHNVEWLLLLHKQTGSVPVRKLTMVAGLCISLVKVVLPGPLMIHNVFHTITQHNSWEDQVPLPETAHHDLLKWHNRLNHWKGHMALQQLTDITVDTDVSQRGWGAISLCASLTLASWWQNKGRWHINNLSYMQSGKCAWRSNATSATRPSSSIQTT